jgi:flagellar biosynthesis protein FlhF
MNYRKFRGATLEKALKDVRKAFGEEAVILSTRKGNGFAEVIAAVDFDVAEIEKGMGAKDEFKEGLKGIREELGELRSLFATAVGDGARRDIVELGAGAVSAYDALLKNGISETLSQRLVRMAAIATSDGAEALKQRCRSLIMERTRVYNPLAGKWGPKILALVGPTGAGKSITAAKLAASLAVNSRANVGMVSLEAAGRGGSEAVQRCGRAIGVPVRVATSKDELNGALWAGRNKDVIIIDTPGRNPKDARSIAALKGALNCGLPVKLALVLSVTNRDDIQQEACKGFGSMPIDSLVFTRLDEAQKFGTIVNSAAMLNKPVSYLCNGQRIPRDIGSASKKTIAGLVIR